MAIAELGQKTEKVHVQDLWFEQADVQDRFGTVVLALLKDAPDEKGVSLSKYPTQYNNLPPTLKRITFKFGNSRVHASYSVNLGTPPSYDLTIETPIVIDKFNEQYPDPHRPLDPHEIVEFRSSPYFGSLDVEAKVVTKLGDFGQEIPVTEYSAGGLLPPIQTLGRGMLQTFESVIALFKGITPEKPQYVQTLRS